MLVGLLGTAFTGCKKQDDEDLIPAYIRIDTIKLSANSLQGGNRHKITDAWIFVDGEALGCFELPCEIPVLKSGKHNILVRAGIKLNGISATRLPYPMYQFYSIDSVNLVKKETTVLNPVVNYFQDISFPYIEDFSSGSTSLVKDPVADTGLVRLSSGPDLLDGSCGAIILPPGTENAQVYTTSNLFLPGANTNVFLEMNYKCDYTFYAGLFVNTPGSIVTNQIIGLNPTDGQWNKIYVNLTPEVTAQTNASSFRLFFRAIKATEDSLKTANIFLDNIKIVHQ